MRKPRKSRQLPVIPLRDMVVFPHQKVPFIVGRAASIEAVKRAVAADRDVFLVMQRDAEVKDPSARDLHAVGTIGRVVHEVRLQGGHFKLLVEGLVRGRMQSIVKEDVHFTATVAELPVEEPPGQEMQAARSRLVAAFDELARLQGGSGLEPVRALLHAGDSARGGDELTARLQASAVEKQEVLETIDPVARLHALELLVRVEAEKVRIERKLHRQVQSQVEKAQREYLLNEKMKAIQTELGRKSDAADLEELRASLQRAGLPAAAMERAEQELRRLEVMPPMSAEASVSRSYLDWLLAVPWKARSRERRDFDHAARILDEDHHGLSRVKERILEFLAVRCLQAGKPPKGSILCFVGPPGVGKTSLGRSIARATGRKFVRLSLGGVRDEAEIRGHRRTYIGAYPGRIVQMMRKAGTRNPVFLLDEVDKMAMDFRGDPSAALLEVLDPEQNQEFLDHYLDTGYDLSEVLFVCTANVLQAIPPPLRDRLEILRLPGYTLAEKVAIGERFLLPRQLAAHGLGAQNLEVGREAMEAIIEHYTREAGVRSLEREIASTCRKLATKVVRDRKARVVLATLDDVRGLLGVPRFRPDAAQRTPEIGVATGLAWTEFGGQVLHVEAARLRGKGKLTVTGQLGDVMQESLRAAVSYVRSRAADLDLPESAFQDSDIHVHVPEGAIPKDGPSAGITLAVAVVSAFTGRPVRSDVAMTGEITLRGRVLPVGGIKEKLLAAHRLGIRRIVMPQDSARDLDDVPAEVRQDLELVMVSNMDEVLEVALVPLPPSERRRASRGHRRRAPRGAPAGSGPPPSGAERPGDLAGGGDTGDAGPPGVRQ